MNLNLSGLGKKQKIQLEWLSYKALNQKLSYQNQKFISKSCTCVNFMRTKNSSLTAVLGSLLTEPEAHLQKLYLVHYYPMLYFDFFFKLETEAHPLQLNLSLYTSNRSLSQKVDLESVSTETEAHNQKLYLSPSY